MASSVRNMRLASVDDLFSTEETRQAEARQQGEQILTVPIAEVHDFENNPYQVRHDAELMDMAESIARLGVHTPCLARPRKDGGYELLSGHRRKAASMIAGKDTLPIIVRDIDDDTATILVVDGNIQRETILPSEKAKAYKMKLEAIKRQGERSDLTSTQLAGRLESADIIGKTANISGDTVRRYIRLTELIPPLLQILREFILREKVAPEGFCLSKEEIRFTLTANSDEVVEFTFEDEPTEVTIEKTDVTTGEAVPGAGITIYDDATGEVVFEGETNMEGCVIVHELPTGRKYRFVESYSPDGFAINTSEFFFTIDEYGNITGDTEITDEPISVIVEKKNAYDSSPMSGVVFFLQDEDGNPVKVKSTGKGYFVPDENEGSTRFAVDENGKAEIRYLKAGNYTLVEETPEGFVSAGT